MKFNITEILDKFQHRSRVIVLTILVAAMVIIPLVNAYYAGKNEELKEQLNSQNEREKIAAEIELVKYEREKCKTCLNENKELTQHIIEVSSLVMDFKILMQRKKRAEAEYQREYERYWENPPQAMIITPADTTEVEVYESSPMPPPPVADEAMQELEAEQWRIIDSLTKKISKNPKLNDSQIRKPRQ